MDTMEQRISPPRQSSDMEMVIDPPGPSVGDAVGHFTSSQSFRLTNGLGSADPGELTASSMDGAAKKPVKKRKMEKNGASPFSMASDIIGAASIPSPCSSVVTSASTAGNRAKNSSMSALPVTGYVTSKDKERNLIYVNYLNAFANSLTVHPPWKRTGQKGASGLPSSEDSQTTVGTLNSSSLDFEVGGLRPHQTTPYLPDVDQDRCGHADSFCPFSKRDGYTYCEKHLLDDKGLPFVPCAFQRLEANPCPYPARMPPGAGGKNRPQRSKEA